MREGIHPKYKNLKVLAGGNEFDIMSTYHAETLLMDVYYKEHIAWTKKGMNTASTSHQNISNFNAKFGGFSIMKPSIKQN